MMMLIYINDIAKKLSEDLGSQICEPNRELNRTQPKTEEKNEPLTSLVYMLYDIVRKKDFLISEELFWGSRIQR